MSELYPLLMRPVFDPRPWGSVDLAPIYPNHRFEEKIGEAWLTGDHCRVANGRLAGKTLGELTAAYGRDLVGTAPVNATQFPLLMKFLFPREKLSVQVHPDDAGAKAAGLPCGKTECWYVAHAQPGAKLALGLKPGVTKSEFEQGIHQQRAEELLNWINVFPGEMIYVAGGTVHTIGPGMVLVETQQQSDTTYRLYDYGRARDLHLESGMAAVKEDAASGKVIRPAPVTVDGGKNVHSQLITAPYFQVDRFELKERKEFEPQSGKTSAQILLAVEGCGVIEAANSESVTLAKGDAVVVPAAIQNFRLRPQWSVELLRAQVPGGSVPEPSTRL